MDGMKSLCVLKIAFVVKLFFLSDTFLVNKRVFFKMLELKAHKSFFKSSQKIANKLQKKSKLPQLSNIDVSVDSWCDNLPKLLLSAWFHHIYDNQCQQHDNAEMNDDTQKPMSENTTCQ